jgi:hypothetical protein
MSSMPEFAVTVQGSEADLDVFEDALDCLPAAVLIGGVGYPPPQLIVTVTSEDPLQAFVDTTEQLRRCDVRMRDGTVITIRSVNGDASSVRA